MRTIKFRGKRCDDGEWVYGYYARLRNEFKEWHCIMTEEDASENYIKDCNGYNMLYTPVNHNTVGQFTGLLDKNGKEIYEGDIVVFYNLKTYCINPDCEPHLYSYGRSLIKQMGMVVFENGSFGVEDEYYGTVIPLSDCGFQEYGKEDIEEELNDPYFETNGYNVDNIENIIGIEVIGNIHDNPKLLKGSEQ